MEELIEDIYTGLKVYTNCKNKTCEVREPATGYSALFDFSFRCLKNSFPVESMVDVNSFLSKYSQDILDDLKD